MYHKALVHNILRILFLCGTARAIEAGMQNDPSCAAAVPVNHSPAVAMRPPATRQLLCPDDTDVIDGVLRAFLTLCLVASLVLCGVHSDATRDAAKPAATRARLIASVPAHAGTVRAETSRL